MSRFPVSVWMKYLPELPADTIKGLTPDELELFLAPERAFSFLLDPEVQGKLESSEFWRIFRNKWTMARNHFLCLGEISRILNPERRSDPNRFNCMAPDEIAAYKALPEIVPVYRGCIAENSDGWSYSLDRERAVWFANRIEPQGKGLLIEATIAKRDIVLYITGRNESEIILCPDDRLSVKVKEMTPPAGPAACPK